MWICSDFSISIFGSFSIIAKCTIFEIFLLIRYIYTHNSYAFFSQATILHITECQSLISNWTQVHTELTFLKGIFQKNGYPEKLIDKCFKGFSNNICFSKENLPTVKIKYLLLILPYLGIISLQTRTKLQQAPKSVLNCCKLEIVFKCQSFTILSITKSPYPKTLYLVFIINFSVPSAMNLIMV